MTNLRILLICIIAGIMVPSCGVSTAPADSLADSATDTLNGDLPDDVVITDQTGPRDVPGESTQFDAVGDVSDVVEDSKDAAVPLDTGNDSGLMEVTEDIDEPADSVATDVPAPGDADAEDAADAGNEDVVADTVEDVPTDVIDLTCTPYVTESGCELNEWCNPDFDLRSTGYCTISGGGEVAERRACSGAQCSDGLYCASGLCAAYCDPISTGDEPGQCNPVDGQFRACDPLEYDFTKSLVLGLCTDACIYDHTPGQHGAPLEPCPVGKTCQPAFFRGSAFDYCSPYSPSLPGAPLEEMATCPNTDEYSYCRPGGVCMNLSEGGIFCYEFCGITPEHPAGSFDHPDCSRTEAICTSFGDSTSMGICR